MKKKAIVCILLCAAMTITCACSNSKDKTNNKDDNTKKTTDTVDKDNTTTDDTEAVKDTTEPAVNANTTTIDDSKTSVDTPVDTLTPDKPVESTTEPERETPAATTEPQESTEAPATSTIFDPEMSNKVRDYILNGQGNASGATAIKWVANFLAAVDIDSLYEQFVAEGGATDDVAGVAWYITENAPIASDWEEMFKENFNNSYGQYPTRVESIDGLLYQAYADIDGKEVPYVVVNARTGYWHG